MNIAIVGYGKMGHEIESICRARGIHAVTIDPSEPNAQFKDIDGQSMGDADVCVEFTHPNSVIDNIRKISKFKKNIVIGTTGWYDKAEEVARIAKDAGIGIIWSGNFSIGVNLYFKMIENAARMMDKNSKFCKAFWPSPNNGIRPKMKNRIRTMPVHLSFSLNGSLF